MAFLTAEYERDLGTHPNVPPFSGNDWSHKSGATKKSCVIQHGGLFFEAATFTVLLI